MVAHHSYRALALEPLGHSYGALALEPSGHSYGALALEPWLWSPRATATEPAHLEPGLCKKRSRHNRSVCAAMKSSPQLPQVEKA